MSGQPGPHPRGRELEAMSDYQCRNLRSLPSARTEGAVRQRPGPRAGLKGGQIHVARKTHNASGVYMSERYRRECGTNGTSLSNDGYGADPLRKVAVFVAQVFLWQASMDICYATEAMTPTSAGNQPKNGQN